jgi:hypothetical protein
MPHLGHEGRIYGPRDGRQSGTRQVLAQMRARRDRPVLGAFGELAGGAEGTCSVPRLDGGLGGESSGTSQAIILFLEEVHKTHPVLL